MARMDKAGREPDGRDQWGLRVWLPIGLAALVIALGAFVLVARATDATTFCGTCHEMRPYYDAWSQGGHKTQAQCIDCHVEFGFFPRLAHKFVALREVGSHVIGNTSFPLPAPATVPDRRCIRCHPTVTTSDLPAQFSHALHAKQGPCEMCHATTGHDVSAQALQAAGIYSPRNAATRAQPQTSAVAAAGAGRANVSGHVTVVCSQCHDMAKTGCAACHKPPHEPRGDCKLCHKPGPKFVFAHPATQMPGWQRIDCKKCHPVSYTQVYCTCHGGNAPTED